jgi:hypothetical protein
MQAIYVLRHTQNLGPTQVRFQRKNIFFEIIRYGFFQINFIQICLS